MKYSILHISDLHRIKPENIECIKSSFEVERAYYAANGLPPVQLIVVSGDIVDGSKEEDAYTAKEQIQKQYETASRFLSELCTVFIGPKVEDRKRVIIIPGNHDVSRYISERSMDQIEHDEKGVEKLSEALWSGEPDIRWSWKTLHFYRINKRDTYNKRFDDFVTFYNGFYSGFRTFPQDPDRQSFLVEFPDLNITFACFNSCYQLDHLRLSGYISPRSLSALTRPLLEAKENGRLVVGVWHHHTHGLPNENNYLDYSILDNMVQNGISVALHGHQHISGIINVFNDVFSETKLNLISAGTLYGNSKDLPPSKTRQYNLLVVDMHEGNCDIILHSREDSTALNEMPAWEIGTIGRSKNNSYKITVPLSIPQQLDEEDELQKKINLINIQIEKTGDVESGIRMMEDLGMDNSIVRKFVLDLLQRNKDFEKIISLYSNPKNTSEAIALVESCIKNRDKESYKQALSTDFIRTSTDVSLKVLLNEARSILKS